MNFNQNNHFNEAYIKDKNCWMDADELIKIYSNDPVRFNIEYTNLYCPDCQKARLTLAFGTERKYLKTFNDDLHEEDCQHTQNTYLANSEQIIEYIKKTNPQTIENKLYHLLSRFENNGETPLLRTMNNKKPSFIFLSKERNKEIRTYIPQQRIKNGENVFLYNTLKYYFGEVLIEIENKSEKYRDIMLRLYSFNDKKKQKLICSIFIPNNDNNKSTDINKISNISNGIYRIAFFGKMMQSNHSHPFNNLNITNIHHIVVLPI